MLNNHPAQYPAHPPWGAALLAELIQVLIYTLGTRSWVPWCRLIGITATVLVWWILLDPYGG